MTQQYTGRNNVTISMPDGGSVPIVSQTEIDPMKIALSLMLALVTTTALTEPLPVPKAARAGRLEPAQPASRAAHSARRRRVLRAPSRNRATARVRGDGLRRARTACEMDARGSSLRARFRFPGAERAAPIARIVEARRQYQLRVPFSQGRCLLLHWNVTTALPSIDKSASVGREH
jgi:hypothetical protein